MKYFIIFLSFVACAPLAYCQTSGEDREADKNALRALGRRYEEAINSSNLKGLADSVTPTASAVFMTGDEVTGVEAMQKFFDEAKKMMGEGSRYTVKLIPDDTEFMGDLAIAKGISEETATLGSGRQYNYTTRWTAVLRKIDGQWKATRLHVSLNPFDNPIVAAKHSLQAWIVGSIAGLIGLGVGLLLGRRKRAI